MEVDKTQTQSLFLLPGENIPTDLQPRSKKGTLTLGPGLRLVPPASITSTIYGTLHVDQKKAALWVEHPTGGHYQPSVGDLVIAQMHHSSAETFHCSMTPYTSLVLLGQLAFEGANKKNRPQLKTGDLVYARVCRASKWEETEIECFNSATGKAEGMGPLKGGMAFDISPAFARRLMMGTTKDGKSKGGVVVLEEIGEKIRFEVAVGRNGKVWVDSGSARETVTIGRCLAETDEQGLDIEAQKKLVRKLLKLS